MLPWRRPTRGSMVGKVLEAMLLPRTVDVSPRYRGARPASIGRMKAHYGRGGFVVIEQFNEMNVPADGRLILVYMRVSEDGQVQRSVAYLRVPALGFERVAALVEHQNALQRFADAAGYRVVC